MSTALGLDLGTTSISALAVAQSGRAVAHSQCSNSAGVDDLPAGHAEQDPLQLRNLALQTLRQLAEQLPQPPHCLGITGQMHGVLLLDERRCPLTHLITWQDQRATAPVPGGGGATYLEMLLSQCDEAALDRTGCRLSPGYLAATLFVLSANEAVPHATRHASCLADWLAAELTNGPIVTDRSNAAASGIYDLASDGWSESLAEAAGVKRRWLAEVCESGTVIGRLTAEMAAATRLPAGLPVVLAIGDNQAAVLGSVPAAEAAIQINIGTGAQINWPIEPFQRVAGMDTRCLPIGRWMLVGAGVSGGDAYAWVQHTARHWLAAFGVELTSEEIYSQMNALAEVCAEDCHGLKCAPLFRGTRAEPLVRGRFEGVSWDNFTLGHVSLAVLQGIAESMYGFVERAGDARPEEVRRIVASGNAVRKNPLLVETVSRRFARPVFLTRHLEEAAYGAALLAGSATQMWPNLAAAGEGIQLVLASPV